MPSLGCCVSLLFSDRARLWPESKIKPIARPRSWHRCCLSDSAERAAADGVLSPRSRLLAGSSCQAAATGSRRTGDQGGSCFPQCGVARVFAPAGVPRLLGRGPLLPPCWFLPNLCKASPDSPLDFHFFAPAFPQGFDLLMGQMTANSATPPLQRTALRPLAGGQAVLTRELPARRGFGARIACRGGLARVCRLVSRSESKRGPVCSPARKPFSTVEAVSGCLQIGGFFETERVAFGFPEETKL